MPRKVFVAGEILTAADVNTNLMDQSVMVFDDAAARATAIPTPSEGMTTYLKDLDAVEFFDGSVFRRVGGLIAVKSARRTGPEVFNAVPTGGVRVIGDMSITHSVADPNNRLIISVFIGTLASSNEFAQAGVVVHDGDDIIGEAPPSDNRTRLIMGSMPTGTGATFVGTTPSFTFVHTPGAGSKTYTVRVINFGGEQGLFVNRTQNDADVASRQRTVSSLVIQEVAV